MTPRLSTIGIATILSDMRAEIATLDPCHVEIRTIKQDMTQQLLSDGLRQVEPTIARAPAC